MPKTFNLGSLPDLTKSNGRGTEVSPYQMVHTAVNSSLTRLSGDPGRALTMDDVGQYMTT